MRAKIKATGEVLKVADRSLNLEYVWLCNKDGSIVRYKSEEVELISEKKIDWEERRFELVKSAMQGWVASEDDRQYSIQEVIDIIFHLADAVIAKLKEE